MQNTTYTYDMDEILPNKEKCAKEFSEGNVFLERALLKLWDEGYSTTGCCAGHPVKETEDYIYPYNPTIAFRFNEETKDSIVSLLSSLDLNNIKDIHFSSSRVVGITGIKEEVNDFFKDFSNKFQAYEERVDSLVESVLKVTASGNSKYEVDVSFENGDLEEVTVTTTDKDIISKLVDTYESESYEYDGEEYYFFRCRDLGFLRKIGFFDDKVIS